MKSEVVDDDSKDFSQVQPKINADGTYATSVGVDYGKKTKKPSPGKRAVVGVRRSIVEGHRWEVAVAVSEALCKIVVRLCANNKNGGKIKINLISARAMRAVAAVLSFALQPQSSSGEVEGCKKIDRDSYDRMLLVISALSNPAQGPISDSLVSSQKMLAKHCDTYDPVRLLTDEDLVSQGSALAVHQPIPLSPIFLETIGKTEVSCKNTPYSEEAELKRILHSSASVDALSGIKNTTLTKNTKLDHVIQLTGFSDEIYAEAYVTINHQDILLDVLLVSQVDFPILNVNVEVGSSDPAIFCVSERPPPIAMLQPNSFSFVKSSVRVQSTASGFIFGAITYQPSSPQSGSMNSANNTMTIVLADVPIDICEFVRPGTGSDSATKNFKRIGVASLCDEETNALFRSTWIGLEWENKIVIPPLSAECISQLKAVDLDCPDEGKTKSHLNRSSFFLDYICNYQICTLPPSTFKKLRLELDFTYRY